jgi:hypothetical protein
MGQSHSRKKTASSTRIRFPAGTPDVARITNIADIWLCIFLRCRALDIFVLAQVCKRFHRLSRHKLVLEHVVIPNERSLFNNHSRCHFVRCDHTYERADCFPAATTSNCPGCLSPCIELAESDEIDRILRPTTPAPGEFWASVDGGDLVAFWHLLSRVSLFSRDTRGDTCIHRAARLGQLCILRYLFTRWRSHYFAWCKSIRDGALPLHAAAEGGHVPVIALLASTGHGDQDQMIHAVTDRDHFTPLHIASKYAHDAAVLELIRLGANRRTRTSNGQTARQLYTGTNPLIMEKLQ